VHAYEPAYPPPTDEIFEPFAYEPYTHAYFPTEHFDETVRAGPWTFARRRDGYVARGADNVWIVELGDAEHSGAFDAFCASCADASVTVDAPGWSADGPHPGFAVRYESPAEGIVEWRRGAPLLVDGAAVSLEYEHRFDNPYTSVRRGDTVVPIVGAPTEKTRVGGTRPLRFGRR
jgi:hypothetical protein